MKKWLWQGRPWQAFKTFAILFSFTVNLVLLLALLIAAPLILPIVSDVAKPIVGGLNQSFVDMGEASIVRSIEVDDEIPVVFTLPLSTTTNVVLVDDVPLSVPAEFILPANGGTIRGMVELRLPTGMELPVALNLEVPVDQTVPVNLAVDVNIPLDETELGAPFANLQAIFAPLDDFLGGLPASNDDLFQRLQGALTPEESGVPETAQDGQR